MTTSKLKTAYDFVMQGWLPVDATLLKEIQSGLAGGRYGNDRQLLYADLKKDFALFLYCLRKLAENMRAGSECENAWLRPDLIFENSPISVFEQILSLPVERYSRHRLTKAERSQTKTLLSPLISASVAENLAQNYGVNSCLAYATALFRELGLSLIAWNYPHIYGRSVLNVTPQLSLDESLSHVLGFSPSLLGVTVARSWSVSPEVRLAVGDCEVALDDTARNVGENLAKLCSLGESLARLNDKEIYPHAKAGWEEASKEVIKQLGAEGANRLQQIIVQNLSHYLAAAPALFELPELFNTALAGVGKSCEDLDRRNKYIKSCPNSLARPFEKFYMLLSSGSVHESVDLLMKEIILPTGFTGGCIFLLEPDSLTLAPRLKIGNPMHNHFMPLTYSSIVQRWDPVVAALRAAAPIIEEHDLDEDPTACYIAGALGNEHRAGVLYLEMGHSLMKDIMVNPLVCFKAIRQALNDALNLE